MPSIKKSVMFSQSAQDYIAARTRYESDVAWSEALNEAFKSLKWLSNQALPQLSATEWQFILNAYSGCMMSFSPPFRIASDLMDDVGAISIEELSPDYAELVKKMHALSQLEQYAVQDFVIKFWSGKWDDCKNWDEIYQKIIKL